MKRIRWRSLLFQAVFWVTAEVALNSIALFNANLDAADDLADYSEFLMQKHLASILKQKSPAPGLVHKV
ncbi:hypothetical protein C8255_03735 [filamentous cyanobacterium CCP3]|nr:hypothetical protein C8255_03735 [filamentous cyanobacterium CCP3]